jgi:DNA-binding transcriptional LysR family regulator
MAAMNLLEALRYLAALEQHRHFGRAAQACRITQPALSNAIRALEQELGVAVVRRSRQYEGLTAEGEVVLAHAHRMLRDGESLRQELHAMAGAPRGRLSIGAVPAAVPVAARFAARLRARHPGLQPVLRSLSSQAIETGLESLSLDLGLGYIDRPEVHARAIQSLPQYMEAYYLVRRHGPARGALRMGKPMRWADAAALPLVLLSSEMHHRAVIDQAAASAGVSLAPALETNSFLAQVSALGEGGLAAVMPGAVLGVAQGQPGLLACPLVEPVLRTPIGVMTHASARPSRALQAALALAQDADWQRELAGQAGELAAPA